MSTEVNVIPIPKTSITQHIPSKHLHLSLPSTDMYDNPKISLSPSTTVNGDHVSTSSKHNSSSRSLLDQYTPIFSSQLKSNTNLAYIQPTFINQSDPINKFNKYFTKNNTSEHPKFLHQINNPHVNLPTKQTRNIPTHNITSRSLSSVELLISKKQIITRSNK